MELIINGVSLSQIKGNSVSLNNKEGELFSLNLKIANDSSAAAAFDLNSLSTKRDLSYSAILKAGKNYFDGEFSVLSIEDGATITGTFREKEKRAYAQSVTIADVLNKNYYEWEGWEIKEAEGASLGVMEDSAGNPIVPIIPTYLGCETSGCSFEHNSDLLCWDKDVPAISMFAFSAKESAPYFPTSDLFTFYECFLKCEHNISFDYTSKWSAWSILKNTAYGLKKPSGEEDATSISLYLTKTAITKTAPVFRTPVCSFSCVIAEPEISSSFSYSHLWVKVSFLFQNPNILSWALPVLWVGSVGYGFYPPGVDTSLFVCNPPTYWIEGEYAGGIRLGTSILTFQSRGNLVFCMASKAECYKTEAGFFSGTMSGCYAPIYSFALETPTRNKAEFYSIAELLEANDLQEIISKIINIGGGKILDRTVVDVDECLSICNFVSTPCSSVFSHSDLPLFGVKSNSFSSGCEYTVEGEITKEYPAFGHDISVQGNTNNQVLWRCEFIGFMKEGYVPQAVVKNLYFAFPDGCCFSTGTQQLSVCDEYVRSFNSSQSRMVTQEGRGLEGALFFVGFHSEVGLHVLMGSDDSQFIQGEHISTCEIPGSCSGSLYGNGYYLGIKKEINCSLPIYESGLLQAPSVEETYRSIYQGLSENVGTAFNAMTLKIGNKDFLWSQNFRDTLLCYKEALWYPVCYKNYNPEGSGSVDLYYRRVC